MNFFNDFRIESEMVLKKDNKNKAARYLKNLNTKCIIEESF